MAYYVNCIVHYTIVCYAPCVYCDIYLYLLFQNSGGWPSVNKKYTPAIVYFILILKNKNWKETYIIKLLTSTKCLMMYLITSDNCVSSKTSLHPVLTHGSTRTRSTWSFFATIRPRKGRKLEKGRGYLARPPRKVTAWV